LPALKRRLAQQFVQALHPGGEDEVLDHDLSRRRAARDLEATALSLT
jgi:hypothetical protein